MERVTGRRVTIMRVTGKRSSIRLELLKIGVEAVLKLGAFLQSRGRSGQKLARREHPAI